MVHLESETLDLVQADLDLTREVAQTFFWCGRFSPQFLCNCF